MVYVLSYLLQNRRQESLGGLTNALAALGVYAAAATWRARRRHANR
jgi:hypothetical protein